MSEFNMTLDKLTLTGLLIKFQMVNKGRFDQIKQQLKIPLLVLLSA